MIVGFLATLFVIIIVGFFVNPQLTGATLVMVFRGFFQTVFNAIGIALQR